MLKKGFVTILAVINLLATHAEVIPSDTIKPFVLGEVTVIENIPMSKGSSISSTKISSMNMIKIPEALDWIPGVTLTEASSRGETMIFLRGFDQTRIPIYIDGISVSVPFDGMIDLGRLQTSSVSKIQTYKGTSSLLLGGNTMGGAVNIVTGAPSHKLEVGIEASTLWNSSLNLGLKEKKWYLQVDGGWIHKKNFRLPSSYHSTSDLQKGDTRHHSKSTDYQLSSKLGFTPKEGDEYVIAYNMVRSDKYVPPSLREDTKPRFWRYKDWDKDQVYFFSKTNFNQNWKLESRLFYDRYYNELKAYDNDNYNSQDTKNAFNSFYDDYSLGGGLIVGWNGIKNNYLKLGANYKKYVHRSHDDDDPEAKQSEYTNSIAIEDTYKFNDDLSIMAGVGYFHHKGTTIEAYEQLENSKEYGIVRYPGSSDNDINYQFAMDYRYNPNNNFRFSFSRNSRFASLKDRYSYKRGKAIPNPNLKTERSYNLDLTYNGNYKGLQWYGSAYYMFLTNVIQEITGVDADDPLIWQLQNKGRADFRGFELGMAYNYKWLELEGNYSYIDRVNKTDKNIKFMDAPDNKWNVRALVNPFYDIKFQVWMTAVTKTNVSSDGSIKLPGYALFNTNVGKQISGFDLKVGIKNLFDKVYYYSGGYPMASREFYVSVAYRFTKD